MSIIYMAIDKDTLDYEKEKLLWLKRGISGIRIKSMTEAIKKAMDNQFLYILINSDNISHYMNSLKILRDATNVPILVATSNFTIEEQTAVINNGADFYGRFSSPEENMSIILAIINNIAERAKQPKYSSEIICHGDILVAVDYHRAFVKDTEIFLNKNEMKILHYLITHRGRVLTHSQIYRHIWNDEYNTEAPDILYSVMKRLRNKIRNVSAEQRNYIENIRDVGYRLNE
jgi:DNA-binding response OmpR family regulator